MRRRLFGPPPILNGEDEEAYDELHVRLLEAIKPEDFIEEIWVRDLADVHWDLLRLRRIQTAYLTDDVSRLVNNKAVSVVRTKVELMEGPEKEEMTRFLEPDSELDLEVRAAQSPRANRKFQDLWASAEADLNKDEIQAYALVNHLHTIERLQHLIAISQRRLDEIIREIDRRRSTKKQRNSANGAERPQLKALEHQATAAKRYE
jgi:hypothetical protein